MVSKVRCKYVWTFTDWISYNGRHWPSGRGSGPPQEAFSGDKRLSIQETNIKFNIKTLRDSAALVTSHKDITAAVDYGW